jgi:hypothetical protein
MSCRREISSDVRIATDTVQAPQRCQRTGCRPNRRLRDDRSTELRPELVDRVLVLRVDPELGDLAVVAGEPVPTRLVGDEPSDSKLPTVSRSFFENAS